MTRTVAEVMSIVKQLQPVISLEDGFFVGVEHGNHPLSSVKFFVVLDANGDVNMKTPLPEMVQNSPGMCIKMIRLEDGRIVIAGDHELMICQVSGEIQVLARVQSRVGAIRLLHFAELIPLINGNMLVGQSSVNMSQHIYTHDKCYSEYTPDGVCVATQMMPSCSAQNHRDQILLLQLENSNIVVVDYDYQKEYRDPRITQPQENTVLDEGLSIKIFQRDLQTEVATLMLRDTHSNPLRGMRLDSRQFKAKTCWRNRDNEPLLAVAFIAPETYQRIQVNIYELDTYSRIDSFKLDDVLVDRGHVTTYITDLNFSESLKQMEYTLAVPRLQCGLW